MVGVMPRGSSVKRSRTISVRTTPAEWDAWDARREKSGRREMGAWVRAVVMDAEGVRLPTGKSPGDIPVVPEVNNDAYRQLVGAGNNINQIARRLNTGQGLGVEGQKGLDRALDELCLAAKAVRGL